MMVEAGANEVPEKDILDGIMFAHEEIKKLVTFINQITAEVGKEKKPMPEHNITISMVCICDWKYLTAFDISSCREISAAQVMTFDG